MPAIRLRDVFMLGYLPAMAAISWLVPERLWPEMAAMGSLMYRGTSRKNALRIAQLLKDRTSEFDPALIATGLATNNHLARLHVLRCYRWDSWRPAVSISGLEHVERALAARKGAILWVAPFVFSNLVTKMALNQAGF